MSSTLQKRVLSLFKQDFPRKIVNSWRIRDNSSRQFHQASKTHLLRCKTDSLLSECLRSATANVQTSHFASQSTVVTSKDETRELMALWPDIVRDLTDAGRHLDMSDATKWLAKVLQYNVPTGKKIRALMVVRAYKSLVPEDQLTEENLRLVRILGWCTELLQSFFLVMDDVEDQSKDRRGQPCWHACDGVGLTAINDSVLLQMSLFQLLKKHFKSKDCYGNLQEFFLDTIFKTSIGQCLDMLGMNLGKKPNLDVFTMDRYNAIVKYKTAYYSFVLPVTAAMYFAGIKDPEMYRQAKTILLEMGHYYQVQDDYLDCYGNSKVTGKTTKLDIVDGKCSWLVVVALQRVTDKQRKILDECYGVDDEEKVNRVVELYNELGLPNTYSIYEDETYNLLHTHIQQISRGLPHEIFLKILELYYRRVT
ncbi:PREDICTED: farnesyl pyrophosphate synthase [Dufourea novaeangliae]|nr:PREDICTED: farnesyl pyrophosphate synthase [Dufourea novaeangliae]